MRYLALLQFPSIRSLIASGVLAVCLTAGAVRADSVTKIIDNGPDSGKRILAILGDGYAAADQDKYNGDVDRIVLNGVFTHDFYRENHNAFNVYRVNLISVDSGVSTKTYNTSGGVASQVDKNTPLKYYFNGDWGHCWLEPSAQTATLKQNALAAWVPNAEFCMIILNHDAYGGCNRGKLEIATPRGVGWEVMAHEMGHGIGGLADEYCNPGTYTGGTINGPNVTTVTDIASVFWNRFVPPGTSVPTASGPGTDPDKSVGLFQGAQYFCTGKYRPVANCRMNSNAPEFCPVCYTLTSKALYGNRKHDFHHVIPVDFDGDGRADALVHNGQDLAVYKARATDHELDVAWVANNVVPAAPGGTTWQPAANDQYFPADFDGDGKQDLYVFNGGDWDKPYLGMLRSTGSGYECIARYDGAISGFWNLKPTDKFFVGDFDGDGKQDLYVASNVAWPTAFLGMLKSTGTGLAGVKRYDGAVPGWALGAHDQFFVGDFDGDGKSDLYVFNAADGGSTKSLGMLRSGGNALQGVKTFTNSLPGWSMGVNDSIMVGDFDGDKKADLYVFNGKDWPFAYLLMAKSTGSDLTFTKRYDSSTAAANIPGWSMTKGDRFFLCDANKDKKADLFVFNPAVNWSKNYLGTLTSSGTALSGSWSEEWISGPSAGWHLGALDQIEVGNYEGGVGTPDIYIHNPEWFGMLRRDTTGFRFDRHYFHWIYSPLYDSKTWSDSLP